MAHSLTSIASILSAFIGAGESVRNAATARQAQPAKHAADDALARPSDIIDVSRPTTGQRPFLDTIASLAGAVGVVLMVPLAILLIGLPVALVLRGLIEATAWLFGLSLP